MFDCVNLLDFKEMKKIKLNMYNWDYLLDNEEVLYKNVVDLLLDRVNLFYYGSQKESSRTIEETKKYIKRLIQNGTIYQNLGDVLKCIGWTDALDINNSTFQGDLSEYLMSIFLDKISDLNTMISKVSLKTSPKMPAFGNDNIYFDFNNDILYYGESKFYNNLGLALNNAIKSIKKHACIEEISFIRTHTTAFIAENNEKRTKLVEKFEDIDASDIKIKSVIFIANDDIYKKEDYEEKIMNFFSSINEINKKVDEINFVFFPILSKEKFLKYFKERLKNV